MAALLTNRFERSVRRADAGTLRDYWAERVKLMRFQVAQMPERCDVQFDMGKVPGIDPAVTKRYVAVMADVLSTVTGADPPGSRQFMVPGRIVEAARKKSGLSEDLFISALKGDGKFLDICKMRLALAQILLTDDSADATRLLRQI